MLNCTRCTHQHRTCTQPTTCTTHGAYYINTCVASTNWRFIQLQLININSSTAKKKLPKTGLHRDNLNESQYRSIWKVAGVFTHISGSWDLLRFGSGTKPALHDQRCKYQRQRQISKHTDWSFIDTCCTQTHWNVSSDGLDKTTRMSLVLVNWLQPMTGPGVPVKVHTLDIVPLREKPPQKRTGMARVLEGSHSFTCIPTRSIRNRNEPHLPLPSQLQLVLIYRPQRDERLSWLGLVIRYSKITNNAQWQDSASCHCVTKKPATFIFTKT